MYCNLCGTELIKGAKFCSICGTEVPSDFNSSPSGKQVINTKINIDPQMMKDAGEKINAGTDKIKNIKNNISKKQLVVAGVCAAVALFVIFFALNFLSIKHFFLRSFMSPEDYYSYIETNEINEMIDCVANTYKSYDINSYLNGKNIDYSFEAELGKRGSEVLSIADSYGIDTSWIKKASVSGSVTSDNNKASLSIGAGLNNQNNVLSADMIVDAENGNIYARIPTVNKEYALFSNKLSQNEIKEIEELSNAQLDIDYKQIADIAKNCSDSLTGNATSVKKGKEKLVVNNIKQKVYTYTATYTYNNVDKAKIDCKKVLLTDKKFKNYICDSLYKAWEDKDPSLDIIIPAVAEITGTYNLYKVNPRNGNNITPNDDQYVALAPYLKAENANDFYEALINDMKLSIEQDEKNLILHNTNTQTAIVTKIYVDKKGNIVGRDISSPGEGEISCKMPMKGNKFGFHMRADMGNGAVATISGSGKKVTGKVDGTFEVSAVGVHAIDVIVKNFDWNEAKKGSLIGKFTVKPTVQITDIVSGEFMRQTNLSLASIINPTSISITLDCDNKPDNYNTKILIGEDKDNIITFTAKAKGSNGKVKVPSDAISLDSKDGILTYIESCELNKITESLSEAGVPLQYTDLLSSFIDKSLKMYIR